MAGVQDTYKTLRDMNKRQVLTQLLMPGNMYVFQLRLANFLGFEATSDPWFVSVAAGAKPDSQMHPRRQTPLHLAAFKGHDACVAELVARGAAGGAVH